MFCDMNLNSAPAAPGIVYILVNDAMPDLVKIGMTADLERRLKDLDNTSVPMPFDVHHASRVANMRLAERLLHQAFSDRRVRSNREFFRLSPDQAAAALRLAELEDVTDFAKTKVIDNLDSTADKAAIRTSRRRSAKFDELGIDAGSEIVYLRQPDIVAEVVGPSSVSYDGEDWSLSALTAHLIRTLEDKDGSWNGWEYWTYEDEKLADLWRAHLDASSNTSDAGAGSTVRGFWEHLITELDRRGNSVLAGRQVPKGRWISWASGWSPVSLEIVIRREELRIELYINSSDRGRNLEIFEALREHEADIHTRFGNALTWDRNEGGSTCSIRLSRPARIEHQDSWPELVDWVHAHAGRFSGAVGDAIQSVKRDLT